MKTLKTCKTGCGKMKSGAPVKKVKTMAKGGQMYGIPQTGPTGPNYQGVDTMKKGGSVKKMQDGGRVVRTKRKTAVPASWRTPEAVKSDRTNYNNSLGHSETYGNAKERKTITGKTVKTPYTESGPGRTSTGTITDKFNRKGQLTKTVTKSNVTSPTGAQYRSKDVNKVSTRTYKKGGSTFGMLSVKAGIDKNPGKTFADKIAGAKKNVKLTKKQFGGTTSNNTVPSRTLENLGMFIGGGLGTALAARKQNQPMSQKKKERVLARQQKKAARKSK